MAVENLQSSILLLGNWKILEKFYYFLYCRLIIHLTEKQKITW